MMLQTDVNLIIILKDQGSYDINELFKHSRHNYTYDWEKCVWKRKTYTIGRHGRSPSSKLMLIRRR
jgi:hypothetical protein